MLKIEGPVWYTIYHQTNLYFLRGKPLTPSFLKSTNQWEKDIYDNDIPIDHQFQPLRKIWKSDWIIIPKLVGENKIHVPNHQPEIINHH